MTVIYADGVFDLFHYGHVRLLQRCANLGDKLIVGVHNDDDVASYKRAPIMTMTERLEVVKACRFVDAVVPNAPLKITEEFLDSLGADTMIHAHSEEDHDRHMQLFYGDIPGGRFLRLAYTSTISTTAIIDKLKKSFE